MVYAASIVMGYTVFSGQQQLSEIQTKEYVYIAIGLIMVMFVAQAIYFFGVKVTNMTPMAHKLLAFPIISLILEMILGRVNLSSLGIYALIGFARMVADYVVLKSKPAAVS